jgi:hypothetical protein
VNSRLGRLAAVELQQGRPERWCEQGGKRPILRRLDLDGDEAPRLRVETDAVQEDRLSDAAQAVEDQAAGGSAITDSVEGDRSLLDQVVTSGERRRRGSGPGGVRIAARIQL